MNTNTFSITKHHFAPKVGGQSLVGVDERGPYPLSFGNYFWMKGGPYIANFWAENLEEWSRRNPDAGKIEVTVVKDGERELGVITDERLKDWCNKKMCITGHGWGSRMIMETVHELAGVPVSEVFCGCESFDELPVLSQSIWPGLRTLYACRRCQREWTVEHASKRKPE